MRKKGYWFYQIAFALYGPMMPTGCGINDHKIVCQSKEFETRGQLLANFQLGVIMLSILMMVMFLFGFAASRCGHPSLYHSNDESQDTKFNQNGMALHI